VPIRFGIAWKILTVLLVVSLGPLAAVGYIVTQQTRDAIVEESLDRLESTAQAHADQVTSSFQEVESALHLLSEFAVSILEGRVAAGGGVPSFYHDYNAYSDVALDGSGVPSTVQGLQDSYWNEEISLTYDTERGGYVNETYSCFKVAPDGFINETSYLEGDPTSDVFTTLRPEVQDTINRTAVMDEVFRPLRETTPIIASVYMGTEDGVIRLFPYGSVFSLDYDPRLRGWYGASAADPDEVMWSDPYVDAAGLGVIMSASKGMVGSDGTFLGVVAVDITVRSIDEDVLDIRAGRGSYAFMVSGDGTVISHPDLEDVVDGDWRDLGAATQDILLFETYSNDFRDILSRVGASESGAEPVRYGNGSDAPLNYIGFAPVPQTGFGLGVVVPAEVILAPADANARSILYTIVIVATLAGLFGGLLAVRITNPIRRLRAAAESVRKGQLNLNIRETEMGDEIGDLAKAFERMVASIRKANMLIARQKGVRK